jgi:hypothetical protein
MTVSRSESFVALLTRHGLLGQAWAVRNRAEALSLTPSPPTTLEPSKRDEWAFTHLFKQLLEGDIARECSHRIYLCLIHDELKDTSLQWCDPASLRRDLEHIHDVLEASPIPSYEWSSLKRFFDNDQLAKLVHVSPSSLQRYSKGERDTPQDVAERLHWLALVVGDLLGSYNDYGIRRWFERKRTALGGRSPREVLELAGDWSPEDREVAKVRDLAASLTALGAT